MDRVSVARGSKYKCYLYHGTISFCNTTQNAIYSTLVQAVGGAFFFVTAYLTYRNVRATEANVKATEEKQVTERFSKAVELLGSDKLEVRMGAIYALAWIIHEK